MAKRLYSAAEIGELVDRLAGEILKDYPNLKDMALIGIRTGGDYIAGRLRRRLEEKTGKSLPLGVLDINLYRDDFDLGDRQPEVRASSIEFSVQGKIVILVDDVLFTGRTIRAALEAINDYGRPAAVRLAVLIDRNHRELPIEANYVGGKVDTTSRQRIHVSFAEAGEEDKIELFDLPERSS